MSCTRIPALLSTLVLAPVLAAAPLRAGETLLVNGQATAAQFRTIEGSTYVKLSDVAKAFRMNVVKRSGGFELTKTGGANQVEGVTQGKIGDVLFDGRWRFKVISMETPMTYTVVTPEIYPSSHPRDIIEFDNTTHILRAKPGYKLVVLACSMSNGQKTTQTFWVAQKDGNNSIADTEGDSHAPVGFDMEGAPIQSKPLLPGAKTSFRILFSLPMAAQPKDLVFTLKNNDSFQKGNDVRVSLQ